MTQRIFLVLLVFLTSFNSFANEKRLVLIPGAASSGSKLWIKGLEAFLGPLHQTEYFQYLSRYLEKEGFQVDVCPKIEDQDKRGLEDRTLDCVNFLSQEITKDPSTSFHIIGHSMGGLIGRRLLDYDQVASHIKSVTAISTPHRGTPMANFAVRNYKKKTIIGRFLKLFDFHPEKRPYINDILMLDQGNDFISSLKNSFDIPVYSISNYKDNYYNVAMGVTEAILSNEIKQRYPLYPHYNDGMIPAYSSMFGIHLGTIRADHMESGCIFYSNVADGCKSMLKLLVPHLKSL